jgi:hypothetical protein
LATTGYPKAGRADRLLLGAGLFDIIYGINIVRGSYTRDQVVSINRRKRKKKGGEKFVLYN